MRVSAKRGRAPRSLDEITSKEFSELARKKPLVILPVGSCEEHGSHLPLCTDSFQAEEIARQVARNLGGLVCPPLRYGECMSTRNFPGTISLTSDTVREIAYEIISELARNGIDKVLVISGHAGSGHMAALREGAYRAVKSNCGLKIMVLSDYDIAYDLRGKAFPEDDGHAGEIETSRMLNIMPELVGSSRPKGKRRPPKYMVLIDPEKHFPSGVMGDSTGASAGKGKRIDDYVVEKLCGLVTENFGLSRTRGGGR